MATHSVILAWRIAWTEEPGGLQFMESRRVGHDSSDRARMPTIIIRRISLRVISLHFLRHFLDTVSLMTDAL